MTEINGKWGAYNSDGSYHQCLGLGKKQEPVTEVKPLTLGELDIRLKRVEKMLFNEAK